MRDYLSFILMSKFLLKLLMLSHCLFFLMPNCPRDAIILENKAAQGKKTHSHKSRCNIIHIYHKRSYMRYLKMRLIHNFLFLYAVLVPQCAREEDFPPLSSLEYILRPKLVISFISFSTAREKGSKTYRRKPVRIALQHCEEP